MQPLTRLALLLALAATADETPRASQSESQQEYWAQIDRRDWSAAIAAAAGLVAAARREAADEPLKLAAALSLLGNAHLGAADYASAAAAYSEALQLVERHGAAMSAGLLDPLRGLGQAFAASGRHEEAIVHLDRALLIERRNFGLFNLSQQGVLRLLAASLTKLGRGDQAQRHMNYMLRVGEHAFGRDDPRLAPILSEIGAWYADVGAFTPARERLRRAIELVEGKRGRSHLALVAPLRGLARTYTQELLYSNLGLPTDRERAPTGADGSSNAYNPINPRYLAAEGEEALERALAIIESQPTPPREQQIETLIQLGDWRQIRRQAERALPLYKRAAALLGTREPSGRDAAPAPLSFPIRVYYLTPRLALRNRALPPDLVDESYVEVEFTVTAEGETTSARVVDGNGDSRQAGETLEAIRAARFRPRFVDGEPIDTPGVIYRETFKTRKNKKKSSTGSTG